MARKQPPDADAPDSSDKRKTLAVFKFSSCDGCQLQLLNLEEHLLELTEHVRIAHFLEARRDVLPPSRTHGGPASGDACRDRRSSGRTVRARYRASVRHDRAYR